MATSRFVTTNYTSSKFVESCGAIVFDLRSAPTRVCLIHCKATSEWLLAKGRRNCNESRKEAALREVQEETGYKCRLLPITMPTRAPAMGEAANVSDRPRLYSDLEEPFMLSIRELEEGASVKLIWWYIAEVENADGEVAAEEGFEANFYDCDDALQTLTFQSDRDVLSKAMSILVNSTC
ncbi:hypothetical protein FZEAL_4143 [Fusarium zealandicum]|uniref:Nudix hydrolase domain-containing protein n=1 Tax=Fusarium zealandicum TaxID=1053134 RepID=A0A8H4UMD6_9HYPO|nr:hypothetical protein FZEAL_4143 [Fusarium zealandicum]